jgi:hypothetical protein
MAKPVQWHGANRTLTPPKAEEDTSRIESMAVFNNGNMSVSCWQLTPEELADVVQNGGKIYLAVLFGPSQPPAFIGSEDSVRRIAVDYGGVWKREKV